MDILLTVCQMRKEIAEAINNEARISDQVKALKAEFEELKEANVQFYAEATGFQRIFERYENAKQRKAMLEKGRQEDLETIQVMTGKIPFPKIGIWS